MREIVDARTYYSWNEAYKTEDREQAYELEVILYKLKIPARLELEESFWQVKVPWIYLETTKNLIEAFLRNALDYPKEIEVNREIKSVNRFQPATFRGRGSKMFLSLGFVIFLLLLVRLLYSTGFIPLR